MIDPVEQDLRAFQDKEANFKKLYEENFKRIAQERSAMDGFLQDLYSDISDEDMWNLQKELNLEFPTLGECFAGRIIKKYFNDYIERQAQSETEDMINEPKK